MSAHATEDGQEEFENGEHEEREGVEARRAVAPGLVVRRLTQQAGDVRPTTSPSARGVGERATILSAPKLPDHFLKMIRAGFVTWSAAQKRAGFTDDAVIVVLGREDHDCSAGQDARGTARLGDPAAIARLFMDALDDPWDGSHAEWRNCDGARVGIVNSDGNLASAVVTFDSNNINGDDRGGWMVSWNRVSEKYEMKRHNPHYEGKLGPSVVDPNDEAIFKSWGAITRLISLAGGWTREMSFARGGGNVKNNIFRFGFLRAANVENEGDHGPLEEIRQGTGCLCLAHVYAMACGDDDPEARATLIERLTLDSALLVRADKKLPMVGGDFNQLMDLRGFVSIPRLEPVAPSWILRGTVTLLIGNAEAGKSTLMHHLALLVGSPPTRRTEDHKWLNVSSADIGHGTALFLSGEDGWQTISDRGDNLGYADDTDIKIIEVPPGRDMRAELERYRNTPDLVLVVVDSARKFLKGSEDESANVDEAMTVLEQFASDTGAAVVLLHHLRRNAKPAGPRGVLEAMRGSQVFIDRPRCVIAMARPHDGDVVSIAVVKKNIPTSTVMHTETLRVRRVAGTERLLAIDGAASLAAPDEESGASDSGVARIVEAIGAAHAGGQQVSKTGKRGIFESRLPELDGMSRRDVHGAANRAIAAGVISRTTGGYLVPGRQV